MKFQFKLCKEDYLTHQLYLAGHTATIRYKQEGLKWLFSLIYVGLGCAFFIKEFASWQGGSFVLLGVIWFVFFPILYKKRYKKSYARFIDDNFQEVLQKEICVEIDNQYVKTQNGESEAKVKLSEVDGLIELKELFFLNLKSGMTMIIPKREVGEVSDFLMFSSKVGIKHKNQVDWVWE